eukprot:GFKZ01007039.1.p1 GENE.GFKZ01007039.1~~GFKZ01007039.1.p1  ORF type:complete len:1351 (+),score=199.42 GFKZ01007039.1:53-4054(+)
MFSISPSPSLSPTHSLSPIPSPLPDSLCDLSHSPHSFIDDAPLIYYPLISHLHHPQLPCLSAIADYSRPHVASALAFWLNSQRDHGRAKAVLVITRTDATARVWMDALRRHLDGVSVTSLSTAKKSVAQVQRLLSCMVNPGVFVATEHSMNGEAMATMRKAMEGNPHSINWELCVSDTVRADAINVEWGPMRMVADGVVERGLLLACKGDRRPGGLREKDLERFVRDQMGKDGKVWWTREEVEENSILDGNCEPGSNWEEDGTMKRSDPLRDSDEDEDEDDGRNVEMELDPTSPEPPPASNRRQKRVVRKETSRKKELLAGQYCGIKSENEDGMVGDIRREDDTGGVTSGGGNGGRRESFGYRTDTDEPSDNGTDIRMALEGPAKQGRGAGHQKYNEPISTDSSVGANHKEEPELDTRCGPKIFENSSDPIAPLPPVSDVTAKRYAAHNPCDHSAGELSGDIIRVTELSPADSGGGTRYDSTRKGRRRGGRTVFNDSIEVDEPLRSRSGSRANNRERLQGPRSGMREKSDDSSFRNSMHTALQPIGARRGDAYKRGMHSIRSIFDELTDSGEESPSEDSDPSPIRSCSGTSQAGPRSWVGQKDQQGFGNSSERDEPMLSREEVGTKYEYQHMRVKREDSQRVGDRSNASKRGIHSIRSIFDELSDNDEELPNCSGTGSKGKEVRGHVNHDMCKMFHKLSGKNKAVGIRSGSGINRDGPRSWVRQKDQQGFGNSADRDEPMHSGEDVGTKYEYQHMGVKSEDSQRVGGPVDREGSHLRGEWPFKRKDFDSRGKEPEMRREKVDQNTAPESFGHGDLLRKLGRERGSSSRMNGQRAREEGQYALDSDGEPSPGALNTLRRPRSKSPMDGEELRTVSEGKGSRESGIQAIREGASHVGRETAKSRRCKANGGERGNGGNGLKSGVFKMRGLQNNTNASGLEWHKPTSDGRGNRGEKGKGHKGREYGDDHVATPSPPNRERSEEVVGLLRSNRINRPNATVDAGKKREGNSWRDYGSDHVSPASPPRRKRSEDILDIFSLDRRSCPKETVAGRRRNYGSDGRSPSFDRERETEPSRVTISERLKGSAVVNGGTKDGREKPKNFRNGEGVGRPTKEKERRHSSMARRSTGKGRDFGKSERMRTEKQGQESRAGESSGSRRRLFTFGDIPERKRCGSGMKKSFGGKGRDVVVCLDGTFSGKKNEVDGGTSESETEQKKGRRESRGRVNVDKRKGKRRGVRDESRREKGGRVKKARTGGARGKKRLEGLQKLRYEAIFGKGQRLEWKGKTDEALKCYLECVNIGGEDDKLVDRVMTLAAGSRGSRERGQRRESDVIVLSD